MKKTNIYIIAEIGVNHNGSIAKAKKLIVQAKKCGANAIKFQHFNPDEMILSDAKKANYQISNKNNLNQYEMLQKLKLSDSEFIELNKFSRKNNIDFLCTPFDLLGFNFLKNTLKVSSVKISSTDLTNLPLLIAIGKSRMNVVVSSGMSEIEDVDTALSALAFGYMNIKGKFSLKRHSNLYKKYHKYLLNKIILMHCTSSYPAPMDELNLNVIDLYRERYNIRIGYSDHSHSQLTPIIAASKNIVAIEVHVTLSNKLSGPDHKSSLNMNQFSKYVNNIRLTEIYLGSNHKHITKSEMNIKKYASKSIVVKKTIKQSDKFTENNLSIMRPGYGISPLSYFDYIGRFAKKDISANTILSKDLVKK